MFYFLALLFLSVSLNAAEQISLFKSDVTVHEDGSMTVREDITANVEWRQIRRGIVREFPTTYKDTWGNRYRVGFEVQGVLINNKKAPYFIEYAANGKVLNFGDDEYLTRGEHTFTVIYKTNRQIGFFADHDEIYWNVTGNGWRLPIAHVMATIHLPSSIPSRSIRAEAYTGRYGSQQKNVSMSRTPDGFEFTTTKALRPFEGMTVVVGWAKGFITQPSVVQKLLWFFDDNKHVIFFGFGWLAFLVYMLFSWLRIRRQKLSDPIIPLFHPPKDMLPGGMRYFVRIGYDSIVLASDVVNMGVKGWLTIQKKSGWWRSSSYLLKPKKHMKGIEPEFYKALFARLFAGKDSLSLAGSNNVRVQKAVELSESHYSADYKDLFDYHLNEIVFASCIAILTTMLAIILSSGAWIFVAFWAFGIPLAIFQFSVRGYTKQGQKLFAEVEGFKLFLATTETDRLKVIGTPPVKTPELYETYLPYAMALGVEEQWSAQFAPLFEKLAQEGRPYMPVWATGWDAGTFRASSFASSMSSSMSSAISSSASVPGSSSGFSGGSGGGGFSGGGGGGGGGGGR